MTNNRPIPESLDLLLTELTPQEVSQAKRDSVKGQIVQTDMVTVGARAQLKKDIAKVQPLIAKLEEQIKKLEIECGEWIQKEYHANSQLAKLEAEKFEALELIAQNQQITADRIVKIETLEAENIELRARLAK